MAQPRTRLQVLMIVLHWLVWTVCGTGIVWLVQLLRASSPGHGGPG